ncbi:MAG: tRNA (N(6)-L-threonylcarbamoyladenosine(37)-C(2))-methylthiotransferase MtaB [Clostridia bacterium]|nr:tRNA (N(6)-L-threonylcarbamoyladenosine(37)-C(2))-methylthiotransferase MtaB [Clostridia bacterium]
MNSVAFHTLGCRVNQYDTQAMLELFRARGYVVVPFSDDADVYVINTCTVTGTGDKKSLQLARRVLREHPASELVLCGCLAQRMGEELLSLGPRLVLGTQRRNEVVDLLEKAVNEDIRLCAVTSLASVPFEPLVISGQQDHTRCDLKIQEGCNNHCTYCIIPSVRGPIRSRPPEEIRAEAARLAAAGYREIVITGIHLTSYGRDLQGRPSLLEALGEVQKADGILRIRLGSLEPVIATRAFAEGLLALPAICPQFHLALQSGSETVLRRMKRRYTAQMYLESVQALRSVFPECAITTDILTGFPGETEAEFEQTRQMIREVGFARIHVFPFSAREGTEAAHMPGQLSTKEKEARARILIADGQQTARAYERGMLGKVRSVLIEEIEDGVARGYTPEYIPVFLPANGLTSGQLVNVHLRTLEDTGMTGEILTE